MRCQVYERSASAKPTREDSIVLDGVNDDGVGHLSKWDPENNRLLCLHRRFAYHGMDGGVDLF